MIPWKHKYNTKKVEGLLFDRNISYFGQSKETPWTQPPFSVIPSDGTAAIADAIQQGTPHQQTPTGSTGPAYVALLLDQLKCQLPTLLVDINTVDITKGFRTWKEITSTSPSNRHIGHYISLLRPDGRKEHETTKNLAKSIMHVHYQMTVLCAKLGISLLHWQLIVMTMLEKEAGHPKLHCLRLTF